MQTTSSSNASSPGRYRVFGTVRDPLQQPMPGTIVQAFDKDIRSEQLLGKTRTNEAGYYEISYTRRQFAVTDKDAADVFVRVYDKREQVLKESNVYFNAVLDLQIDIDLAAQPYIGLSDYDQMKATITPFIGDLPLSSLTENNQTRDISFLVNKTGLPQDKIEDMILAFRFNTKTNITLEVFYGVLREGIPGGVLNNITTSLVGNDFETMVSQTFNGLVQTDINILMNALQKAITENIIPYKITQQLQEIKEQLTAVINHAEANSPSAGSISSELFRITNNSVPLSAYLTDKQGIKDMDSLLSLANLNATDWEGIIKNAGVAPPAGTGGNSSEEKVQNYAANLEQNVAKRFPTAVFAANLAKDDKSAVNDASSISRLLNNNPRFNLLNSRIGNFAKANANTFSPDPATTDQLRKIQRVFRLSPDYKTTNTLLANNIHSAAQIYSMGKDNFTNKYGESLGMEHAADIFRKAKQTYAQSLALATNLKSLSDASALNVFPNYNEAIESLTVEVPDLQTLFGNGDFCQCNECNSVYGAAAYLTDILHFLDERNSSITGVSVKDFLLYRRPDIGDIDLDCDNTNTELPYIDIACELMEDYMQPPIVALAFTYLPKFVVGVIDGGLFTEITSRFIAASLPNVAALLTPNARVSDKYSSSRFNGTADVTEDHWMIRDKLVTLKATNTGSSINVQLLHQTLLSSDEINANPEYVNIPAYNKLKSAQRPFTLPFDLFETEGEIYLQKSGVSKSDLIKTFANLHDTSGPPSNSQLDLAYAYLHVNEAERTLIFKEDIVNQVNYWGSLASGTSVKVDDFEQATGLAYSDIVSLLGLVFINPALDSLIQHDDLSCDTDKQHITNLTPAKFDHMHRFIRLWKKTSLQMQELDAMIQSSTIGNGKIDGNLAVELQHFLQLQKTWSLDVFQLLSFYQNIDTNGTDNLYNQLFQNRTITNPVNSDFSIASVQAGALAITPVHISVISAATGLQPDDLNLLIAATDGKLSLKNLSFFYRSSLFTQALSISISDQLNLGNIIHINPFNDPATTSLFLGKFITLTTSGFSVAEINYVLRHQDDQYGTFIPTENQIAAALSPLQTSLLQVRALTSVSPDPKGVLLTKWLTDPVLNWSPTLLTKLMDILNASDDTTYQQKIDNNDNFLLNLRSNYFASSFSADLGSLPSITIPDSLTSQISYDNDNKLLVLTGYMSSADLTNLLGLSPDPAYQGAVNSLYKANQQTDNSPSHIFFPSLTDVNTLKAISWTNVADRFAYFLNILSPVYRQIQQQNIIVAQISNWFKADKKVASGLLTSVPAFYTDYTADGFVNKISVLTAANYPAQFTDYLRLQKICFVVNKLKLSADDLEWQFAHAGDVQSLDYMNLPLIAVSGPATTFANFETLINILKFEQHYPEVILDSTVTPSLTLSIYDIFNDAIKAEPVAAIAADLVTLTGWDAGDMKKLVETPNYLNVQSPADLKSSEILIDLHQCFKILKQINIHADDAIAWGKPSLTAEDATKIVETLKSRYADTDWLSITQPLQNNLREMKRDALVAWLLANPGSQTWTTDSDLYDYFLLDVEMGSCLQTSRIVQATNSVQLFVQRCMLLLENNIVVDSSVDSDWTQWDWMKYFRLWQANYKVFLYPENWIEPDLLPVKSSFFSDLQNNLQQNEATEQNVEDAFMTYLEKLDSVARLEVKNMWYDDPTGTLYVFAGTYGGDPKTYYFRKLVQNRQWTPWEKIDLDVNSDYIVPVVYNNRIYLFWAVFTEQSNQPQQVNIPNAGDTSYPIQQPDKYWQIQMAYSEYKNGKWSPKKVSNNDSTGYIIADESSYPDKTAFLFTALDVPKIDLKAILNTYQKNKDTKGLVNALLNSLSQNGNLVISCFYQPIGNPIYYNQNASNTHPHYTYIESFELDPCRGYPVVVERYIQVKPVLFDWSSLSNMLDDETSSNQPLSLQSNAILNLTPGIFNNVIPLQMGFLDRFALIMLMLQYAVKGQPPAAVERGLSATLGSLLPFFYQDNAQTYYVRPEFTDDEAFEFLYSDFEKLFIALLEQNTAELQQILSTIPKNHQFSFRYHFFNFYHPLVCYFMRQLFTGGIDALMSRDTQLKGDIAYDSSPNKFSFKDYYSPTTLVYDEAPDPVTYPNGVKDPDPGYPKADVDFDLQSGYALYNWELFFHAPLMIAEKLDQNRQFEDAENWYRYIFNPSDTSNYPSPDKFWVTKPFFINVDNKYFAQRIDNILQGVDSGAQDLLKDVSAWRDNPFQPHYIAEYRTVAYQKTAVMKYLDHLIAWGDYLFTQDTMESVSEATQLYILASQILGPKPQIIPPAYELPVDNYYQLQFKLDALSNAIVEIENLMPLQTIVGYTGIPPTEGLPQLPLYFCLPVNDQLLGYWDTIANRLFNIRHCLNIEGVYAPPTLFAPPINPELLVRAAAAGLDIGSILNDLNSPLPYYRFSVMTQKTTELVNEVKSLGASLLSALEKQDAEALALLRSGQEISLLKAVMAVKNGQVNDAQSTINTLTKQQELIQIRINYYQGLISTGLNAGEITALALNSGSTAIDAGIAIGYTLSGGLKLIPDFMIGAAGFGGSPTATAQTGGHSFGDSSEDFVKTLESIATALDKGAAIAGTLAGYARRSDDWKFQLSLAQKELEQVQQQILGAQIRLEIANLDVQNQQLQIDNAQATDDFMHNKFTNADLYNWMITQISNVYFQAYNLTYSTAKKAEQCFRYELGLSDSAYIHFGYWNSLKKGLLCGEQLMYDLKNMEMAYYEQNQREYELTKHISLSQLDGVALMKLKTTGECWINLPEELFDMDYPGHYMRRIKSVALTIPCVAGPFTTVSCNLTLNRNSVRTSSDSSGSYPRKISNGIPADDLRFRDAIGSIQSIATSSGQNDTGLFEFNFHDERYLPYEGAGAISLWYLTLPAAIRQFDYDTIGDVIIHLRYTAREGGAELGTAATTNLQSALNKMLVSQKEKGLMRIFSARNEFPTEWYAFLNPASTSDDQILSVNLSPDRFPYFASEGNISINTIELVADNSNNPGLTTLNNLQVVSPANVEVSGSLKQAGYGSFPAASFVFTNQKDGLWQVVNKHTNNSLLSSSMLKDILLIVHFNL